MASLFWVLDIDDHSFIKLLEIMDLAIFIYIIHEHYLCIGGVLALI